MDRKTTYELTGRCARGGLGLARAVMATGALLAALCVLTGAARAEAPPAINPFGPVQQERDDAVLGYVELSDGTVYYGRIYMTRDKRLKIFDEELERQREVPLNRVGEIEAEVVREWMEKEWRFKELALDVKEYTGRSYPAREYLHTITLDDGRKIRGPLAELIYIEPENQRSPGERTGRVEPMRFILHKRDKGEVGTELKSLVYVKRIKLGEEAYEEGKQRARRARSRQTPESRATREANR